MDEITTLHNTMKRYLSLCDTEKRFFNECLLHFDKSDCKIQQDLFKDCENFKKMRIELKQKEEVKLNTKLKTKKTEF